MFFNKNKATWKAAFKLLKEPIVIRLGEYNSRIIKIRKAIDYFNTNGYLNELSYDLSSKNNFAGISTFYWNTANIIKELRIKALRADLAILEDSATVTRKVVKYNHDL
jgi:hypothetical protein